MLNGQVFVHGVHGQVLKVLELVVTLHNPCHLEVSCKLDRRVGVVVLEELLLILKVWLALHERKTLNASAFID